MFANYSIAHPWKARDTLQLAASHGQLEVCKWITAARSDMDVTQVCALAAKGGHLAALQWARAAIDAPWGQTVLDAVESGYWQGQYQNIFANLHHAFAMSSSLQTVVVSEIVIMHFHSCVCVIFKRWSLDA